MTSHPRDTPQFYLTAPSPCPYLPGQEERKVFTHLVGRRARDLNEILTQGGFRRSQTIAYRPACETCRACISVRVVVDEFEPSASQRRILARGADWVGTPEPNRPASEQYALFRRYLDARHGDGGMVDMTVLDYAMMVEDSHVDTHLVSYRRHGPDTAITGRGSGPLEGEERLDHRDPGAGCPDRRRGRRRSRPRPPPRGASGARASRMVAQALRDPRRVVGEHTV
ncbi:hypothetical protein OMR07_15965, partial [Methylobacterium organophilum]|nr:hypothetical protein [Methylobacterium organophilum]